MPRGKKGSSPTEVLAKAAVNSRAYYTRNKIARIAAARLYAKAHPAKISLANRRWREASQLNAAKAKKLTHVWRTKHRDYMLVEAKKWRLNKQELAAGCKKPKWCGVCRKTGRIEFDHCHVHGHFRGWLCSNCNSALSWAKDSAKILRKLAVYLETPPVQVEVIYRQLSSSRLKKVFNRRPSKCQVCSSTKRICADHCHKTRLFRGWLCHVCNAVLGRVYDSPKILRKLADYLDNDKQEQKELKKNAKTKK